MYVWQEFYVDIYIYMNGLIPYVYKQTKNLETSFCMQTLNSPRRELMK